MSWQPIATAPKDGTMFLACDPRFSIVRPAVRRIRYSVDDEGYVQSKDMGAWLYVDGLAQVENDGPFNTDGSVEYSIACDEWNRDTPMLWRPLPEPPAKPAGPERKK